MKTSVTSLDGLDLLSSAVLILDASYRITYANAAAENLLETSIKTLMHQRLDELFLNGDKLNPVLQQAVEHQFADKRQDLTLERLLV